MDGLSIVGGLLAAALLMLAGYLIGRGDADWKREEPEPDGPIIHPDRPRIVRHEEDWYA